jgi:two-component system sensor histidine kinase NblS
VLLNIKFLINWLNRVCLNFKLQTRLILLTTIIISLILSNIASLSITTIQQETKINDARFARDTSALLGANIISLINEKEQDEIFPFCERFYRNSPSIRYIVFFDKTKEIFHSIPFSYNEIMNKILYENDNIPKTNNYIIPSNFNNNENLGVITKLNLISRGEFLGVLIVGINSNPNFISNSRVIRKIIIYIFISFWITLILGAVFNALTITQPIKKLLEGVKNIAAGNFLQRVNTPLNGELGELIISFNEMGRKLQRQEEKNTEELIREKTKLESLVLTIADGALLLDTNLKISLVNSAAVKIFGWKKQKLVGTKIWDHLPKNLQKKVFLKIQQMILSSSSSVIYGEINDKTTSSLDECKKSIRITLNIVYGYQGQNKRPTGIALTVQDITNEFELNQTRTRFISNVSHELRTPLFNIKSFIETLNEYYYRLSNYQKKNFLKIINTETDRLTRLVNNVLSLSKLDSVKEYPTEVINLDSLLNQLVNNYQFIANDKQIKLSREETHLLPNVSGNLDLLLQVLINLIGNSLKFTYLNGEIIIRTRTIKKSNKAINKIRVEIIDTGIGVPEIYKKQIFQRFVRIENTIHTLEGTGLGLSIVETILEKFNSRLHLVSNYKVGSIFWFELPTT